MACVDGSSVDVGSGGRFVKKRTGPTDERLPAKSSLSPGCSPTKRSEASPIDDPIFELLSSNLNE
jgi:hypothetical protein